MEKKEKTTSSFMFRTVSDTMQKFHTILA